MSNYLSEKEKALQELAEKGILVLATSSQDVVTARSMSVVVSDGKVYFQTGRGMDKYRQLAQNKNVALCASNLQIQGVARDLGPWEKNPRLLEEYKKRHANSYEAYGSMRSQTVVEVTLRNLKKWEYRDGNPYLTVLDFERETVKSGPYSTSDEASNAEFNLL